MKISDIKGKNFVTDAGEWYGTIRDIRLPLSPEFNFGEAVPFAEDGCGNFFLLDKGSVLFWDHETDEVTELTTDFEDFRRRCTEEEPDIELNKDQIISVWIDPEFAKEYGLKTNNDDKNSES